MCDIKSIVYSVLYMHRQQSVCQEGAVLESDEEFHGFNAGLLYSHGKGRVGVSLPPLIPT